MPPAPLPPHERERLATLAQYQVLDTPAEPAFDDLVRMASELLAVPMAMISLIDHDRQWFKAKVGIEQSQTPRSASFCAHALLAPEDPLIVSDATQDPRFSDNPWVTGETHLRFYAGIPLVTPEHHCLGTFCVSDTHARQISPEQVEQLQRLARQVMTQLDVRRSHLQDKSLTGSPLPTTSEIRQRQRQTGQRWGWGLALGVSLMALTTGGLWRSVDRLEQATQVQNLSTQGVALDWKALYRGLLLERGLDLALVAIVLGFGIRELRQRQQIEAQLRQDRNFTINMINGTATLVWVIDPEGRILRFNPACERLTGYSLGEVLGQLISDLNLLAPQSWGPFHDFLGAIYTHQTLAPEIELCCRHRQGSLSWIRFSNSALYDSEGRISYITCMGVDITQQQRIQEALKESEANYRDLFESAHDLIQSVNPQGKFLFVNRAWRERLGYGSQEIEQLSIEQVVHPKYRLQWRQLLLRAATEDPLDPAVECLLITRQGGYVAVEGHLNVHRRQGQVHSIRAILRDVTLRKQAEDAFRQQSQRNKLFADISLKIRQSLQIKTILRTTVDEVCDILSADRVLIYRFLSGQSGTVMMEANIGDWPVLEGLTLHYPYVGLSREKNSFESHHQEGILVVDDVHNDLQADPLSASIRQALGQWQVKAALVVPVFLHQRLWGLMMVHQCSGCRHWQQQEIDLISQLANQLGIALSQAYLLAQERSRRQELTQRNQELQQARQVAEAAAATKGIFLATMSHEVRTPLNAMLVTTELLQNSSLSSEQEELLATLQENGHALLELVNGILDISKLEAGGIRLDSTGFDLRQVMETSLERFALAAEAKGLALDLVIEPGVPTHLQGDPTRLRQIIDHLLSNAVKFTQEGSVAVAVTGTVQGTTLDLLITVTDTGLGIEADYLPALFTPFSQRDGSSTRRYGGTGLGLALCQQLTLLMKGQIGVESQPDQGSRFWVRLPFGIDSSEISDPADFVIQPEQRVLAITSPFRQQVIRSLLTPWGLELEGTHALAEGLEQLGQEGRPTLCLLDWQLLDQAQPEVDPWPVLLGDPHPQAVKWILLVPKSLHSELKLDPSRVEILETPIQADALRQALQRVWQPGQQPLSAPQRIPRRSESLALSSRFAALGSSRNPLTEPPQSIPQLRQGALQPSDPDDARSSHAYPPSTQRQDLGQPQILVVEDNPVNRKLILRQLQHLGFKADVAEDGQQALEAHTQKPYDIVLMDCMMPVMDGYTATRRIRQLESHTRPEQPVTIIAVTANAFAQDRDQCLVAGMDDHLSKPISADRLKASLDHWIQVRTHRLEKDPVWADSVKIPRASLAGSLEQDGIAEQDCTPSPSQDPINTNWLSRISGGDRAFEQELIETFLQDAVHQRAALSGAVESSSWQSLAALAHRMKGASGNLGADRIQQSAIALELAAKQQDPDGSRHHLADLEQGIQALVDWVQKEAQLLQVE